MIVNNIRLCRAPGHGTPGPVPWKAQYLPGVSLFGDAPETRRAASTYVKLVSPAQQNCLCLPTVNGAAGRPGAARRFRKRLSFQ
jgi:hypothetical protein